MKTVNKSNFSQLSIFAHSADQMVTEWSVGGLWTCRLKIHKHQKAKHIISGSNMQVLT